LFPKTKARSVWRECSASFWIGFWEKITCFTCLNKEKWKKKRSTLNSKTNIYSISFKSNPNLKDIYEFTKNGHHNVVHWYNLAFLFYKSIYLNYHLQSLRYKYHTEFSSTFTFLLGVKFSYYLYYFYSNKLISLLNWYLSANSINCATCSGSNNSLI